MPGPALTAAAPGTAAPVPGWFGKVVMLGDFAHRRLPRHFINVCDPWLSQGISASRVQLGSRWMDTYLTGPVWRFAWAPGIVDERWWFGVLMPSVDAVGRYFPLVVCGSDPDPPLSAGAFERLSAWYAQAGQAALGTLQPGASLDDFEADLERMPPWQGGAAPPLMENADQRHRWRLEGTPTMAQWAHALARPLFSQHYGKHSFWWPPQGQPANEGSLTVVAGLPDPDRFSLMLEGRW